MAGFRAIVNKMRRAVHTHLHVPAFYRATEIDDWIEVDVRIATKFTKAGDFPDMDGAQVHELNPQIIFLRDQVTKPARNSVISVETGEAWRVADCMPPNGITITANVTRMAEEATTGFPVRVVA